MKHSQHCRAVQMARTALTGGIASNAPNGQAQPSGLVPLHSDSTIKAQSKVEPGITKLMPFGNTVDLIRAASKALARDPSQLDVQESQHPVFSKQFICNIYCKNYAFGQTQTTARGWSAMVPRLGLGGGNQPSKCMAVVEAYKKSDDHPWCG